MRTIKDIEYNDWFKLDWEEMLDITINTMFMAGKINVEEEMSMGEYGGTCTIELSCIEDDDKLALTEGWLKIKDGVEFEFNIWRGNGFPRYMDEDIWDDIHSYLENLID